MNAFKKTFLSLAYFFSVIFAFAGSTFADSVKDTLEMRLEIAPVFKLSLEMQVDPSATAYTGTDLVAPSQNSVVAGQNLNGVISLGHLLARKQNGNLLPLVSEYKVLMKVHCETNHHRAYVLTQKLDMPLTGVSTHAQFPETAFVCQAALDNATDLGSASVAIREETPVRPGALQTIYQSNETGTSSVGSTLNLWYWISDRQADKALPTQQSDVYQSTLTITMLEL